MEKSYPVRFTFFESYSRALSLIPDDDRHKRAELALSIIEYGAWGIEPDFGEDWASASTFETIRPNLDSSVKRFLANVKKASDKKKPSVRRKPRSNSASLDICISDIYEPPSPEALADAMAVCYEQVPDSALEEGAAYMLEEHELEREALRQETELQEWLG